MPKLPINHTKEERKTADGYRLYEGKYPSVSDVLSLVQNGGIKRWIEDIGEEAAARVRDEATALGSMVHGVAHKLAKAHGTDEEIPVPENIAAYCGAVARFFDVWVDEVIACEVPLVSHDYGFGGTADLIAKIRDDHGGGIAVVDYKVAKKLTREYNMQTAAYALAARENGYPVDRRLILHVKKPPTGVPGSSYVRKCDGPKFENDERGFLGLLGYLYFKDNEFWRKIQEG